MGDVFRYDEDGGKSVRLPRGSIVLRACVDSDHLPTAHRCPATSTGPVATAAPSPDFQALKPNSCVHFLFYLLIRRRVVAWRLPISLVPHKHHDLRARSTPNSVTRAIRRIRTHALRLLLLATEPRNLGLFSEIKYVPQRSQLLAC